ncbi:MAG: cytochrome c, partial [Gallionellaceae bacterium]|nr:cytochrome c [Gallionellaceae bacterium]
MEYPRILAALFLLLFLLLLAGIAFAADILSGQDAGKRIYREGQLPSGALLRGVLHNGTELSGSDAACIKCHRRSGLGSGEGQKVIRPITGKLLFEHMPLAEQRLLRVPGQEDSESPAYDEKTFIRALREGVNSSGRTLDELMPRFDMNDGEIAQLAAYLKNLSREDAPGVSVSEIHFASVITPGADPIRAQAMLDVLQAFISAKNAGTRKEGKRKRVDRERMYSSYRSWVLHVWKLEGLAASWPAQLEDYYRKQPVFAMLSGIGAGNWKPVHEFCEQVEL